MVDGGSFVDERCQDGQKSRKFREFGSFHLVILMCV